jgi:hypothetical protein
MPAIGGGSEPVQALPIGRFAYVVPRRFDGGIAPRFLTVLTGRNLPKIRQSRKPEPSTINEKTIADFTRAVEQTDILERDREPASDPVGDLAIPPSQAKDL